MAIEPLLVIHGIGNRSEAVFNQTTAFLQEGLIDDYQLVRVFWGDLGGVGANLEDTLPDIFPGAQADRTATRALAETDEIDAAAIISARVTGQSVMASEAVRSGADAVAVRHAIADAVRSTQFIKREQDVELLSAVADQITAALSEHAIDYGAATTRLGITVRAGCGDQIGAIIRAADAMIGKITGQLGGTLNQLLRRKMAMPVALSLGDVVGYHQNRPEIHQRLFDRLDRDAPGWGTRGKPINVMAHSLGGLLALDAALGAEGRQLEINRLVTFGSQPAFFHVMAPRYGLPHYEKGKRVTLPDTIRHWTNLWHRLDVLAFVAEPVFELHDGSDIVEVDVTASSSEIAAANGWLHSYYWRSTQLLNAL